ncbi:radical SAM protein, partial [Chloroflexota bacterium]
WANARANIFSKMSESEIDMLLKAGLKSIYVGIESGSQDILRLINKEIEIDDIYKTLQCLSKYDINIELSYMLGLPGDNTDKLKTTISQIYELLEINNRLSFIDFCFFQPYPGTSLYNESLKWGYPQLRGIE